MSRIPFKILIKILADPFYKNCARQGEDCSGRITFEHAILYAGKQVQEVWAIIPLCWYHHLGEGLNKRWNIDFAMSRATEEDKQKYPRLKWLK